MTSVTDVSNSSSSGIGGQVDRYHWHWQGKQYQVVYETIGQGNPVLLQGKRTYLLTFQEN